MKFLTLLLFFTASVAGQDLLTALQSDPNTVGFASLLQEHPDLVANLDPTIQYAVFAPSNDAVTAFRASIGDNGTLQARSDGVYRRSISDTAAAIALLFTKGLSAADFNAEPADLITNLTDPAFINLGTAAPASNSVQLSTSSSASTPSSAQSIPSVASVTSSSVQLTSNLTPSASSSAPSTLTSAQPTSSSTQPTPSFAQSTSSLPPSTVQSTPSTSSSSSASPPTSSSCHLPKVKTAPIVPNKKRLMHRSIPLHHRHTNSSTVLIYSGFGDTAQASTQATAYSNGTIQTVDSFFSLFGDLQTTLQQKNCTAFLNSLQKAGILDSLSNTPKITIFVPEDSVLQGRTLDADTLKQYIVYNTLATTTGLSTTSSFNSSAGESINSTITADGSFMVNNAFVTGPNVMMKNGVIHLINNVFTPTQVVVSAALVNAPALRTAVIAVAIAVSCFGAASF